jgi:N,N'-diacetylchitobiose transport system substrate-binding protein
MKHKLGAFALVGASAVALAGCAGGNDAASTEPETGDLTVWLVGTDTPQTARDYLTETFEAENEGWTLTIEEKTWADVSDTYTAALSSNDSPDVVEVGNTQALGFADAGLFLDISDTRRSSAATIC